jgi:hypothetical protein
MRKLKRVVAMSRVSTYVVPVVVPTGPVYSDACVVFPWQDYALYGVLSSSIHRVWVDRYTSTMKSDIRYSRSDCFDTYPMPGTLLGSDEACDDGLIPSDRTDQFSLDELRDLARNLHVWRSTQLGKEGIGLTSLYGRFHSDRERDAVIDELRSRHVTLDCLVRDAYGWADLELGHGFHDTRYGRFFTVSTEARFELLMRLLQLNFEQAAEQTGRSRDSIMREAQQYV